MKKYKVGDTVHVVECGNLDHRRINSKHYDATITKVGRKYFYIDGGYRDLIGFHLDSGRHKTEFCENYRIVESEESYLDEKEANLINRKIISNMSNYGVCKFSLAQLKAVAEILELEG